MKRVDINDDNNLIAKYRLKPSDRGLDDELKRDLQSLERVDYDKVERVYIVPPTGANIQKLWDWGYKFPPNFQELMRGEVGEGKKPYEDIKLPPSMDFLRPYQKEAVKFLKYRKGRGLLADDMGIGKTIEALGWIKGTISKGAALIIVPTVTKKQWLKEYLTYIDERVGVLYGQSPYRLSPNKSYIINWEILQHWEGALAEANFTSLIADEVQYASNSKAKRTKAMSRLARQIPYFIPMSGTPITSNPKQFYPILSLLDPLVFASEWKYLNRYCEPKHNGYGVTFNGATNTEELHEKIKPLMIRRHKREVLKDLPPLTKSVVPIEIGNNYKVYKEIEDSFFDKYKKEKGGSLAVQQSYQNLKLQLFDMKLPLILKWIDDFLESGEKLLVGVWHHHVIDTLQKKYGNISVKINGTIRGKKREEALRKFNTDKQILFLQMKSGGVGLDGLQKVCNNAVFVELGDTPTILDQFEARLERSGQTNPVNVYYLLGEHTIEQDIMLALDHKRININAVVEGKATEDKDLLTILYEIRKNREN